MSRFTSPACVLVMASACAGVTSLTGCSSAGSGEKIGQGSAALTANGVNYAPPSGCALLYASQALTPGMQLHSCNGKYSLYMQYDGNVVWYATPSMAPQWASGTFGTAPSYLGMQPDGNLVYQSASGQILWASGTHDPGAYLDAQDDGNLVIYSQNGVPIWATSYQGRIALTTPAGLPLPYNPPSQSCGQLLANEAITVTSPGQSMLFSCNWQYSLGISSSPLNSSGGILWSQNVPGSPLLWGSHSMGTVGFLAMQADGNLVLGDSSLNILWQSHTDGHPGSFLYAQNDGNLVVYAPSGSTMTPIWSSKLGGLLPASGCGGLASGQSLSPGKPLYTCYAAPITGVSSFELLLQYDGNLVSYENETPLFAAGTNGVPPGRLEMQPDGNLVLYASNGVTPLWASNTWGNPGAALTLDPANGDLEVYSAAGAPLWSSASGPVPRQTAFAAYDSVASLATASSLTPVAAAVGPSNASGSCTAVRVQLDDVGAPNPAVPSAKAVNNARYYVGTNYGNMPVFFDPNCTIAAASSPPISVHPQPLVGPIGPGPRPSIYVPDSWTATGLLFGNQATVYLQTAAIGNNASGLSLSVGAVIPVSGGAGRAYKSFKSESGFAAFPSVEPPAPATGAVPVEGMAGYDYSFNIAAPSRPGLSGSGSQTSPLMVPAGQCDAFVLTVQGSAPGLPAVNVPYQAYGTNEPLTVSGATLFADAHCKTPWNPTAIVPGVSQIPFYMAFSGGAFATVSFQAFGVTANYYVDATSPSAGFLCIPPMVPVMNQHARKWTCVTPFQFQPYDDPQLPDFQWAGDFDGPEMSELPDPMEMESIDELNDCDDPNCPLTTAGLEASQAADALWQKQTACIYNGLQCDGIPEASGPDGYTNNSGYGEGDNPSNSPAFNGGTALPWGEESAVGEGEGGNGAEAEVIRRKP